MTLGLLSTLLLSWPADLRLQGVVVCPSPERSSALLSAEGRARVVAPGERAFGARLVSVALGRVVLEAGGERRELVLPPSAAAPRAAWLALPDETPKARTLERAEVERRLVQELPRILAETALLPVADEGRVSGFTLTRLPEGSLLAEVGLQPGDVLTEINGTAIDSLATLAGLYARLRGESEIRAVVLRGGSAQTLTLRLR